MRIPTLELRESTRWPVRCGHKPLELRLARWSPATEPHGTHKPSIGRTDHAMDCRPTVVESERLRHAILLAPWHWLVP